MRLLEQELRLGEGTTLIALAASYQQRTTAIARWL